MSAKSGSTTIHVIRRARHWYADHEHLDSGAVLDLRADGGVIKVFTSARRAERFRARMEAARRHRPIKVGINPFKSVGGWRLADGTVTSFPEPVLDDWLRDVGLEPPMPPGGRERVLDDWIAWWTMTAPRMTQEQRAHVWKALDKIHFYEIVSLTLE